MSKDNNFFFLTAFNNLLNYTHLQSPQEEWILVLFVGRVLDTFSIF